MKRFAFVLSLSLLAPISALADEFDAAARNLSMATRNAGLHRVAVAKFEIDGADQDGAAREAERTLVTRLVQDDRLALLERSSLPLVAAEQSTGGLRSAQAILTGEISLKEGRAHLWARVVDAQTGVIIAASEVISDDPLPATPRNIPDAADFPYGRFFDRASALLTSCADRNSWRRSDCLLSRLTMNGIDDGERAAAALALSRLGDGRSAAALERGLADSAACVRAASAVSLGLRADPAGRARVAWLLRTDTDARVRRAAELALSRLPKDAGLRVF